MDFNKEIYPDQIKEKLEKAVINSAENYVEAKIAEEEMKCRECSSQNLEAEVNHESTSSYSQKAVCSECGTERSIEVDTGDLSSMHSL
ncbi:MAG: hypothetical protein ABEK10_02790 [Candidatus Nanosalina sp.]